MATEMSVDVRECPLGQDRLNDGLNEPQLAAIEMLAVGKSLSATASALQVDPRTLRRWRRIPGFQAALAQRRETIWSGCVDRVRALISPALDVVEEQLAQRYDRTRFRAATLVLSVSGLRRMMSQDHRAAMDRP